MLIFVGQRAQNQRPTMQKLSAKKRGEKIELTPADAWIIISTLEAERECGRLMATGTRAGIDAGIKDVQENSDLLKMELERLIKQDGGKPAIYKNPALAVVAVAVAVGIPLIILFTPIVPLILCIAAVFSWMYFKEQQKTIHHKQNAAFAYSLYQRGLLREKMERAAANAYREKAEKLGAEMSELENENADLALVAMSAAPMAWDADTEAEADPDYEPTQTPAPWMGGIIGNPPIS